MNTDFDKKLEDMLVIPFMVILYGCILIPLIILCYQGFYWLREDTWPTLSLVNLAELCNINLAFLDEPGWTGMKSLMAGFINWPLAFSSAILILAVGWLMIIIFCIIVELVLNDTKINND